MAQTVALPWWLLVLLVALAGWSVLDRLLLPSVRWVLRRRVRSVLDELETRLHIRIQPFKLTRRRVLIDRLVFDPQVIAAAEEECRASGMPREVAQEMIERYAREIVPRFNAYVYFRLGYRLARFAVRALYRVRVGSAAEEELARIDPRSTVVFVMNHRSNVDYLLVSYLVAERTALSYAVGEWARIWPLQSLIQAMGAYFVRRRSGNPLYRKVLERYIAMATAAGVTQAVYPEGGLSRDGALQPPRLGVLDYMLRGFDPQGERDIVFVPVGINYDRTLEDRTLLLDLDREAPRQRGLGAATTTAAFVVRNLWQMARSEWHRFGYACVNFGAPVSARAYLAAHGLDLRGMDKEERFRHVGSFAAEVMAAIGRLVPVLPVALMATVLLREGEAARSELELKAEALALVERLRAGGAQVYVPRRDLEYTLHAGLRTLRLRRLVREEDGLLRVDPAGRPVVGYYARSIAHLLAA